jgi:hypothetical protein
VGSTVRAAVCWIGTALLVTCSAQADWSDSFSGNSAPDWTFRVFDDAGAPPATGALSAQILGIGEARYLRISHSTIAQAGGGGGAALAHATRAELFSDVLVVATINANPSVRARSVLGVLARANPGNGNAYAAMVDFRSGTLRIDISVPAGFNQTLASSPISTFDPAVAYELRFTVIGSQLHADVSRAGSTDVLAAVDTDSFAFSLGQAGIVVATGYTASGVPLDAILGTFDNVSARIPEQPCRADFNGDGFLDFFDLDDFTSCFEGAACPLGRSPDYNCDGFVDFFDFDDFVTEFAAGC